MEFYCGTGGLVRAYSDALSGAIGEAVIVQKDLGYIAEVKVGYQDVEKLKYYFGQQNIKIINSEYEENVKFIFEIQKKKYDEMLIQKAELKFEILNIEVIKESYIFVKNSFT